MCTMADRNRALQGVGLAIIIVTLAIVGISFNAGTAIPDKAVKITDMVPSADTQQVNSAALTSVASVDSNQSSAPEGSTHTVQILFGAGRPNTVAQPFFPSSVIIRPGDSVRWVNEDNVIHTVTSTYIDSGQIWPKNSQQGPSSYEAKFNDTGVFSYFCEIHPYMSGAVYVGVDETQREVSSTNHPGLTSIEIEMPQNAAYQNKYGPFFIPENAIVPSGSRVTWVNHDFIAHTATASGDQKLFDTGPVTPSSSASVIVNGTGRIAYYCEIHPWMQGSLTIVNPKH